VLHLRRRRKQTQSRRGKINNTIKSKIRRKRVGTQLINGTTMMEKSKNVNMIEKRND
jgi:hypothetical protein